MNWSLLLAPGRAARGESGPGRGPGTGRGPRRGQGWRKSPGSGGPGPDAGASAPRRWSIGSASNRSACAASRPTSCRTGSASSSPRRKNPGGVRLLRARPGALGLPLAEAGLAGDPRRRDADLVQGPGQGRAGQGRPRLVAGLPVSERQRLARHADEVFRRHLRLSTRLAGRRPPSPTASISRPASRASASAWRR